MLKSVVAALARLWTIAAKTQMPNPRTGTLPAGTTIWKDKQRATRSIPEARKDTAV